MLLKCFSHVLNAIMIKYFVRLTSGQTGVMFVTTLKVSFEQHLQNGNENSRRKNKLLKETDIPLSR